VEDLEDLSETEQASIRDYSGMEVEMVGAVPVKVEEGLVLPVGCTGAMAVRMKFVRMGPGQQVKTRGLPYLRMKSFFWSSDRRMVSQFLQSACPLCLLPVNLWLGLTIIESESQWQ